MSFSKARRVACLLILVMGCLLILNPPPTYGQEKGFPSKPIEIIVPFAPGGALDIGARIIAEPLSRELKTPVIVNNKAGGGGLVGASAFANAKPDGYTILCGSAAMLSSALFADTHSFDPRKDFQPLGYIGATPISVLVAKNSPFKTFDELLQYAKKNPGKLQGGVSGLGGEAHIMFMSILNDTKMDTKMIPYNGQGPITTALLGGHIDWEAASLGFNMPYIRSGEMRSLLLTSRHPDVPGVPAGPDIGLPAASVNMWMGFLANSKIPKPVSDRLVSAIKVVSGSPSVKDSLAKVGWVVSYKDPQDFSKFINSQWDLFVKLIKETGMKVN